MLAINGQDLGDEDTSFYFNSISSFLTPEVRNHFVEVVLIMVSEGKLKPGEVVVTSDQPWLHVKKKVSLETLCLAFAVYASRINWCIDKNGQRKKSPLKTAPNAWLRHALLEQRLWEIIVFCLIIERGVSEGELQIYREFLSYGLGYVDGFALANIDDLSNPKKLEDIETSAQLLGRARQAKFEKLRKEESPFYEWASERLLNGDQPSTLEQVLALPGFKSEWSRKNEKSLRGMFKKAGFVLKPGRPPKD